MPRATDCCNPTAHVDPNHLRFFTKVGLALHGPIEQPWAETSNRLQISIILPPPLPCLCRSNLCIRLKLRMI